MTCNGCGKPIDKKEESTAIYAFDDGNNREKDLAFHGFECVAFYLKKLLDRITK